jgi:hypothetical protein
LAIGRTAATAVRVVMEAAVGVVAAGIDGFTPKPLKLPYPRAALVNNF